MFWIQRPVFIPTMLKPERDREEDERGPARERGALLESGEPEPEDVQREDDGRERERREVEDVVRPVEESREEPLPRAEGARRPDVEAALLRNRGRERGDGETLRNEEGHGGQHPEKSDEGPLAAASATHRIPTIGGHVEEDDVAGLEGALQGHSGFSSLSAIRRRRHGELGSRRPRAGNPTRLAAPGFRRTRGGLPI
jgi:hypothetical protein